MKNLLICIILITAIFLGISHCSTEEFPEMIISTKSGQTFPASNLIHRPEKVILYYWSKNDPHHLDDLILLNKFHKRKNRPKMASILMGTKEEIILARESIMHSHIFHFPIFTAITKSNTPMFIVAEAGVIKKVIKNPNLSKILEEI